MGVLNSFKQHMMNRVLLVDVFAGLFGMGAWLSVNGVYTQLPLLVNSAPEGWNLPSYIVILIQMANVGAVVYGLAQRYCAGKVTDSLYIYLLMIIGCVALVLMAFFHSETSDIFGATHSTALLLLIFACALVACTSSVLFIPYMSRFRETYLVSYMIGEGLSAFIPSITSLIQGIGGNPTCIHVNASDAFSELTPYTPPPVFSIKTFLLVICFLQVLSLLSFFCLNNLPQCRKERSPKSVNTSDVKSGDAAEGAWSGMMRDSPDKRRNTPATLVNADGDRRTVTSIEQASEPDSQPSSLSSQPEAMDHTTYATFLTIQALVSTFANGLFPALQTYSCLPYGNVAYHLAINLGSIANPLACYTLFFVSYSSMKVISVLSALGLAIAAYIFTTATMSPNPPLVGTTSGEALVVISWILFTGFISYVKLAIATRFRKNGGKGLFWYGAMTQVGAAAGSIIGFSLLKFTSVFTSYEEKCLS